MTNKPKLKSKSAISFKEFQHIANEVIELGNDWGFYVDIETNHKLIDFNFIKTSKINKNNYIFDSIKEEKEECKENTIDKNKKIIIEKKFYYFCNFMKNYFIKYTFPIISTFMLSYYIFKVRDQNN